MYRPNRIGPWPFVSIESVPLSVAATAVEANIGIMPKVGTYVDGNTLEDVNAVTFNVVPLFTLVAGEGVALGCMISGAFVSAEGSFLLSYGGVVTGFCDFDTMVSPVLGRRDPQGGVTDLTSYSQVPACAYGDHSESASHPITCQANGTVVIGDFRPEGLDLMGDLFFGFWFQNMGSNPATFENVNVSASLHRYLGDKNTFDPNR